MLKYVKIDGSVDEDKTVLKYGEYSVTSQRGVMAKLVTLMKREGKIN